MKTRQHTLFLKGFTLIELLVVIAIIGLLSAVILPAISSSRVKARNSQRLSQIKQIITSLNVYADDNGGVYPVTGAVCIGVPDGQTCWSGYKAGGLPGSTALMTALGPYLNNQFPQDPLSTRTVGDRYIYQGGGGVDFHCNGGETRIAKVIAWQPDSTNPSNDAACSPGVYACCSGLGCSVPNFCVLEVGR